MESIWSYNNSLPQFPTLFEDISTDVLIIGGGITGILCAYMLSQKGIDYVLVEAEKICSGITKNTTAKITSQHGLIYQKLIREFGIESASLYLKANNDALDTYKVLCKNIDCDFKETDSYVYSINSAYNLEKEIEALEKLDFKAEYVTDLPLPFKTKGAVQFKSQAQFDPLKFLSHITKKLKIYEHTKVTELIGTTAKTDNAKIKAKKIIVATHFPFINKHGSYFLKMYQHRSYVLGLSNAEDLNGMFVDENEKGLSFRNSNGLLLLGGGSHRTGKTGGNWKELEEFKKRYYPKSKIKYRWATQDCMTLDNAAYIGKYSALTKNLYVATGYNKWGMTTSMVAAKILCDMILDLENPFCSVFSPSRTILRPKLCVNAFEAVTNILSFSKKRCPHLGCALKWNSAEHSWDCPCHGSRFDENGVLLDNPATNDLE